MKIIFSFIFLFAIFSCELNLNKKIDRAPQSTSEEESSNDKVLDSLQALADDADSNLSDESASNTAKICSLPADVINLIFFQKYCKNGSCFLVNRSCVDHSDCCSSSCINGKCAADQNNFVPINEKCKNRLECESGICEKHPFANYKICFGTNRPGLCSILLELALDKTNCCSDRIYNHKCIGSPGYPTAKGKYCAKDHDECASQRCNFVTHLCM